VLIVLPYSQEIARSDVLLDKKTIHLVISRAAAGRRRPERDATHASRRDQDHDEKEILELRCSLIYKLER
jgi:hypothetical protein